MPAAQTQVAEPSQIDQWAPPTDHGTAEQSTDTCHKMHDPAYDLVPGGRGVVVRSYSADVYDLLTYVAPFW